VGRWDVLSKRDPQLHKESMNLGPLSQTARGQNNEDSNPASWGGIGGKKKCLKNAEREKATRGRPQRVRGCPFAVTSGHNAVPSRARTQ